MAVWCNDVFDGDDGGEDGCCLWRLCDVVVVLMLMMLVMMVVLFMMGVWCDGGFDGDDGGDGKQSMFWLSEGKRQLEEQRKSLYIPRS